MKRILFLLSIMIFMIVNAQAQKVEIQLSDLTPEQRAKIEAQQKLELADKQIKDLQMKVDTYGKWIGVGGEVGQAVKEGLTAVVDVADKFGKTDVGQFTLIMVAWKVMGKDVIQIFLGLIFFAVLSIFLLTIYKRVVLSRRIMINNPGFWRYPKEYKIVESKLDGEETAWLVGTLIVGFLLGIWITYAIMF